MGVGGVTRIFTAAILAGAIAGLLLTASSVTASFVSNAVFWVILCGLTGFFVSRPGEQAGGREKASPAA